MITLSNLTQDIVDKDIDINEIVVVVVVVVTFIVEEDHTDLVLVDEDVDVVVIIIILTEVVEIVTHPTTQQQLKEIDNINANQTTNPMIQRIVTIIKRKTMITIIILKNQVWIIKI